MARFFVDWELWLKLIFILACGIAITVTVGCSKVVLTHWRVKRSVEDLTIEDKSRFLPVDARHQGGCGSRMTHTLFGAAALQSGLEIEGIWTPQSRTPETSIESLADTRMPLSTNVSTVFGASPQDRAIPKQFTGRCLKDNAVMDRSAEVEVTAGSGSNHLSDDALPASTGYCSLFMLRHPEYAEAMAEIEAEYQAAKPEAPTRLFVGPSSTQDNEDGSQLIHLCESIATAPPRTAKPPASIQDRDSDDLSMLDRQRRAQVAETGQLTPRLRRGHSSPPTASNHHSVYQSET